MQSQNNYYGGSFSSQATPPSRKPLWRRTPVLIFIGLLVVATIALGIVSTLRGSAVSTGKAGTMLTLIQKGDGTKSYDLLSKDGQATTSKEEWILQVIQLKNALGVGKPKLVYSQKLEATQVESAYNAGEKGSIYRVVIVNDSKSGLIDSLRYNKTSL